jgi:hypothetical protein
VAIMTKTERPISEKVLRAHREIDGELKRLEEVIAPSGFPGMGSLHTNLDKAYSLLIEHFRIEEEEGYMTEVLKKAPNTDRIVRDLQEQHKTLSHTLGDLMDDVKIMEAELEKLCAKLREWIEMAQAHELRESSLLTEVFGADTETRV